MLIPSSAGLKAVGARKVGSVLPRSLIITRAFFPRCCSVPRDCSSRVASAPGWEWVSALNAPGLLGRHTVGPQVVIDRW